MDPFVTLAVAGAITTKLKLGTGVLLVQQRDTIQTAKLVASLDQESKGRFLFGVGGGWNQDEMENHGTEFATRFKRMRESIEAMKEIWTKSKAEYPVSSSTSIRSSRGRSRCRSRTRRSMSGARSRKAHGARSVMATAGSRSPEGAT